LDVALSGGFVVVHVGLDVGLVGFAFFGGDDEGLAGESVFGGVL
jgi:hypothetical protein